MGTPFAPREIAAMRRALRLAARGGSATSPNPQVGCVILDPSGTPVGEGWHRYAGGPHAEVEALADAGDAAREGTAIVTLEPCDHTGRTGPCTQALLRAGIRRVVYAVADPANHSEPAPRSDPDSQAGCDGHAGPGRPGFAAPDPLGGLAGADGVTGARTLAAAGVEVAGGLLADEAIALNREWLVVMARGEPYRPYVTYKYAATLDGRTAAADGTSRWITGPEARADVHRLRAESDAVLVGSGTAAADDPQLAVRGLEPARQPLRVVLDTEATAVRPGARVLDAAAPTLIAVADDLPASALAHLDGKAEVVRIPRAATGGLRPETLLHALFHRGVLRLLLEGGPTLAGSMIRAGLVDRVRAYLAPALLGAGPAAVGEIGVATIADAPRLRVTEAVPIGPDLRITAEPLAAEPLAAEPLAAEPLAAEPLAAEPRTSGQPESEAQHEPGMSPGDEPGDQPGDQSDNESAGLAGKRR